MVQYLIIIIFFKLGHLRMIDSNSEKSQNIHLLVKYSILKLISHFITQYPLIQMGTNFTGRSC